jgi:hypothetical protein
MIRPLLFACLCGALAGLPASASGPSSWEMDSYRDFIAGRIAGLSLSSDGRLTLAPKMETVFDSGQPIIWSVAAAPDGTVYIGTGHRGRVFRIAKSGQASLIWTAEQPEVFALALDSKGTLFAGTSPDGRIYRIEDGKATEYFAPGAKYIWSLAFGPDGALYAGTGDQGKIFRIQAAGKGEVYYETGQENVTSLAIDAQGRLVAGTDPNGLIYRITAKDKAFVLYDASLPEIRTLIPTADGAVYAAALGGSMSRRSLGGVQSIQGIPSSVSVGTATTTVTVEASATQAGIEIKPKPGAAKPQAAPAAGVPVSAGVALDTTGVEKSAIYRINPDNTVESLWSSKDEDAYDLLQSAGGLVFSTDGQGRVYRLGQNRQVSLIAQTNQGEATRLTSTAEGILAVTGDLGKVYRLNAGPGVSGTYEAPVHDSNSVARWGRLSWRGAVPDGARMVFRTRSGNSSRVDNTWSDWSGPLADADGSPIQSPNARYIQWQAELTGPAVLDGVTLAYLPQNTPPVVRTITVTSQLASVAAKVAAAQAQSGAVYTVTASDTGDAGTATSTGTPTQAVTRPAAEQLQIAWQADDPDGDRLSYSLYFRGEDEREWKLLKSDLSDNGYSIDSDSLADGRYYFRVVASDAPSNPPSTARTAELISAPTLIDRTPPVVTAGAPKRSGAGVEIEFDAVDAESPLRRAEYSLDAGTWVQMEPVEGILDARRERFLVKLDGLAPGEHLLVVRALDSDDNAGLAKVVLR